MRWFRVVGVLLAVVGGIWMAGGWLGDFFSPADDPPGLRGSGSADADQASSESADSEGLDAEPETLEPTRAEQPVDAGSLPDPEATWIVRGTTAQDPGPPLAGVEVTDIK